MISFSLTLACVASMAVTLLLCLYAEPICSRLEIIDVPDERKRHARATPLLGGLALMAAVLPLWIISTSLVPPDGGPFRVLILVNAVVVMAIVGLADDIHNVSPGNRLAVAFLVFLLAGAFDKAFLVQQLVFQHPAAIFGLGSGWAGATFTALCCVGLLNAVNMADGKNGLVIGLCLGWLLFLGSRAPLPLLAPIAVLISALAVLLMFNLRGRLFLGDGGSYGLAAAVGLLAILIYNTPAPAEGLRIAAEELVLLFCVPVIDAMRLVITRLMQGRSPMSGDRNHLHHLLLDRFGWPGGLGVYYVLAFLPIATYLLLA